ncbi:unnamed protein product [Didymodactylos carnosus]|uniref:Serine/threonine-protein kinase receptor n=1 Tax=Didymodactylos carnosus TaxID=1234261 RepID=A0A814BGS4_9BILA|nr:unnamed protein product [Didymodactylos carnosus]CAF1013678.1 unnamed protein product [Didymodactylos carnosus]CAF3705762.1 unnamed protein product [Didymodactylos carnosus]CAF3782571.1 unnamed protein product [Didymodactylos carnosus]
MATLLSLNLSGKSLPYQDGKWYCSIIALKKNKNENFDRILDIGCYKEQALTASTCENKNECVMKKIYRPPPADTYYRCCCDKDYCNNDIIWPDNMTTIYETVTLDNWPNTTTNLTAVVGISSGELIPKIVIGCVGGIVLIMLICGLIAFLFRRRLCDKWHACKRLTHPQNSASVPDTGENEPFLFAKSIQLAPQIIKKGRFCTIHMGIISPSQERVIVKILAGNDTQCSALYKQEKMIYNLPNMKHDNILKFYGSIGEESADLCSVTYWIVTEYCANGSLYDMLKQSLLSLELVIEFVQQITRGLDYLHKDMRTTVTSSADINDVTSLQTRSSIAHRDFKSQNVLIRENMSVCICDFGMAVCLNQNTLMPNQHNQSGTPRYMAPEILECTISSDTSAFLQSDVYALGLVLWEIVSRCKDIEDYNDPYQMPYEDQCQLNPSIPDMYTILKKSTSIRPKIHESWYKNSSIKYILTTIEHCWVQDPDARITAATAYRRMSSSCIQSIVPTAPVVDV